MRTGAVAVISAFLLLAGLAGCESTVNTKETITADVVGSSYAAADILIQVAAPSLDPSKPLIAATFVNIDDLEQASTFGRIVSEQVASRLSTQGYLVIEMLLRNDVFIKQGGGEFLLSREIRSLSSQHDAQAVIVGTYAVGRKNVFVSARLIRASDSVILGSYDYSLPLDPDVAYMLRGN